MHDRNLHCALDLQQSIMGAVYQKQDDGNFFVIGIFNHLCSNVMHSNFWYQKQDDGNFFVIGIFNHLCSNVIHSNFWFDVFSGRKYETLNQRHTYCLRRLEQISLLCP